MSAFAVSAETSSALTSDANLTELTPTAAAEVRGLDLFIFASVHMQRSLWEKLWIFIRSLWEKLWKSNHLDQRPDFRKNIWQMRERVCIIVQTHLTFTSAFCLMFAGEVMSFATDFASSYATSVATTLGLDNTTVKVTHSTKAEKMQFESMKNRPCSSS